MQHTRIIFTVGKADVQCSEITNHIIVGWNHTLKDTVPPAGSKHMPKATIS